MAENNTETLVDLPPSAKLVYLVLRECGPMTQRDITEESMLPPRTARYAINRLKELDILTEQIHIRDARQIVYEIPVANGDSDIEQRGAATTADD
jgi:DNA-binding MarR family transcriptional regulator